MKTIGLIGGMSWESTVTYYQIINKSIKEKLGGLHSAKIILYSVDFAQIEKYQADGDWDKSAEELTEAARKLEAAGSDFIVICTNTMHKIVPRIQPQIHIPILHIADAAAEAILQVGMKRVALLGTKYTLTQDFYKGKLLEKGLEVLIPDAVGIKKVNDIIYNELCLGIISDDSRNVFMQIIKDFKDQGAEAVILGCTEIGLLIRQTDSCLPVFDTTLIHAQAAAQKAADC